MKKKLSKVKTSLFFLLLASITLPAFSQSPARALPHNLPSSAAVQAGDVLYISGKVGYDPATDTLVNTSFRAQVKQAMENIGKVLKDHELSYNSLVSVTIYLTDMDRYAETNEIYRQYFTATYPARVCVAVKQLPLNADIEISAIAALSSFH